MTKQEAVANHRKMWNWIADETQRRKRIVKKFEYFSAMNIPKKDKPVADCYCCEYDNHNNTGIKRCCGACPVKWPGGGCGGRWGLYTKWEAACHDWQRAAKVARKIAELPERRSVKDETD